MRTRFLVLLEKLALCFMSERSAERLYPIVNKLRRLRFNVPTAICDDCGYCFPADEVGLVIKSNHHPYWVCVQCKDFGEFIRSVLVA